MYKLKEPRWKLKSKGYRSFHVAAPRYWNNLPDDVHNIELDLNDFKKSKTGIVCGFARVDFMNLGYFSHLGASA